MSPLWSCSLLCPKDVLLQLLYTDCSKNHRMEKQYINATKVELKLFKRPAAWRMTMQQPVTRWPDVAVVAEFAVWPNCNHGKYPLPHHLWTQTYCSSILGCCHTMTSSIDIHVHDIYIFFFQLTTQPCWCLSTGFQLLEMIHTPLSVYLPH